MNPHVKKVIGEDEDLARELIHSTELPVYTVLGFMVDGFIYVGYFEANNPYTAMAMAAEESPDVSVVAAIRGRLKEDEEMTLPGTAVVDGRTILEQPDVFPPDSKRAPE